ncbi:hypothetical protein LCGC14_2969900 [marine sediment metagenome]|uniref:Uncharacterized protein n=1 Tax=marine sediment metagenome TaxID=412755 RepID=A0A0F8ZHI3_9ZZZZ
MSDLESLVVELDQAEVGSRKLDCRIHTFVTGEETCESTGGQRHPLAAGKRSGWIDEVPLYTTSINLALTLVPERWIWQLSPNECELTHEKHEHIWVSASTASISLCIAALKAKI